MRQALVPDVAGGAGKCFYDGVGAVGVFGAVQTAAGQQTGDAGDGDAVDLCGQDVLDACLQVGDVAGQAVDQAARDFTQEHTGFGAGVEERHRRIGPDAGAGVAGGPGLGQGVEHAIGQLGRGKDLVVGEVGDAAEHIRIAAA